MRTATADRASIIGDTKAMKTLLEANTAGGHRRVADVFRDFCELAAISLRNRVDPCEHDTREQRYLKIASGYSDAELDRFSETLALLTLELGKNPSDVLGHLYMTLDLGNDRTGQFFTPYHISVTIAQMSLNDASAQLATKPFITLNEPACGSGGMVIAAAQVLRQQGINYQQKLHVTAQDIDITAVHMSYIQLSLLGVPAVVIHGSTLATTAFDRWPTPAHVLDTWSLRLANTHS